jgi:hypothetical protein
MKLAKLDAYNYADLRELRAVIAVPDVHDGISLLTFHFKNNAKTVEVKLEHDIRRLLTHVLPQGFAEALEPVTDGSAKLTRLTWGCWIELKDLVGLQYDPNPNDPGKAGKLEMRFRNFNGCSLDTITFPESGICTWSELHDRLAST